MERKMELKQQQKNIYKKLKLLKKNLKMNFQV